MCFGSLISQLAIWKHLCLTVAHNALDVQDCVIFELWSPYTVYGSSAFSGKSDRMLACKDS